MLIGNFVVQQKDWKNNSCIDQAVKSDIEFTVGAFNQDGMILGTKPYSQDEVGSIQSGKIASPYTNSLIKFAKFREDDKFNSNWERYMPVSYNLVCLAINKKKIACAFSNGHIYILLMNGAIQNIFIHSLPIITIAISNLDDQFNSIQSKESTLAVVSVYSSQIEQSIPLASSFYEIGSLIKKKDGETVIPIGKGCLVWFGYSSQNYLAYQDSLNKVNAFYDSKWNQVCRLPNSNYRFLTMDYNNVTVFDLKDPKGVLSEFQIGNIPDILVLKKGDHGKSLDDVNRDLMRLQKVLSMTVNNDNIQDKTYNEYQQFVKEIKQMIELRKIEGFYLCLQNYKLGVALDFIKQMSTKKAIEYCMETVLNQKSYLASTINEQVIKVGKAKGILSKLYLLAPKQKRV